MHWAHTQGTLFQRPFLHHARLTNKNNKRVPMTKEGPRDRPGGGGRGSTCMTYDLGWGAGEGGLGALHTYIYIYILYIYIYTHTIAVSPHIIPSIIITRFTTNMTYDLACTPRNYKSTTSKKLVISTTCGWSASCVSCRFLRRPACKSCSASEAVHVEARDTARSTLYLYLLK